MGHSCFQSNWLFIFQMAQELEIIEKDPEYFNPYKAEAQRVRIIYVFINIEIFKGSAVYYLVVRLSREQLFITCTGW